MNLVAGTALEGSVDARVVLGTVLVGCRNFGFGKDIVIENFKRIDLARQLPILNEDIACDLPGSQTDALSKIGSRQRYKKRTHPPVIR